MMTDNPGQIAYEADIVLRPLYHDGSPRPAWRQLSEIARWSWERNPTAPATLDDGLQEG